MRTGWTELHQGVAMPNEAFLDPPHVQWNHIDGPLMHWAGQLHWLTFRERLRLALRLTTVTDLAETRWPEVVKIRDLILAMIAASPDKGEGG